MLMAKNSAIGWTDHTFNIRIGCTRVSEGCVNCYAEALDRKRFSQFGGAHWGPRAKRHILADSTWKNPVKWDKDAAKEGTRKRVFCCSLADAFEDVDDGQLERLWALIRVTPNLDWQLLTKRPENIARMLPADWSDGWPNVWLGATVENQRRADERIPILRRLPAVVRFLSCEPLLEPIGLDLAGIGWVIVGAESGPFKRPLRPMELDWVRSLRDQCLTAGARFFFKQADVNGRIVAEPELDGIRWAQPPPPRLVA
jgi:protein gp37